MALWRMLRLCLMQVVLILLAALVTCADAGCKASGNLLCRDGAAELAAGDACDPLCSVGGDVPLGPFVCRVDGGAFEGPACKDGGRRLSDKAEAVPPSDVDAVPDASGLSDMVFAGFRMANPADCLIWPGLTREVKDFIVVQASKYGPSASAIRDAQKLGTRQKTEFFLSIEQVSILLAQLLCGATEKATLAGDLPEGSATHPQPFAFGRAMEHWYYSERDGRLEPRNSTWRRTTLVGYGTFTGDADMPNASSTLVTGADLDITSGCDSGGVADSAIGDPMTMTVVFAGHYVGGWMWGWHNSNARGAQEEKIGTLVPEMMLATEPLRKMGAGLLSNGQEDPWLPEGGWYIIGAGSYVKGLGYPRWGSEKFPIDDDKDYFNVGNGRRMRRRGIVAIMAKPCNDRGSCGDNSRDLQYRCYNRQVKDRDVESVSRGGGNLWGIAAGAFDFEHWPARTAELLRAERAAQTWVLQGGGWGAGAFGCGTLYGGLVQALAAKRGGWRRLRMCWAGRGDPHPTLASKFGYAVSGDDEPLMLGKNIEDFAAGKMRFSDGHYPRVAERLRTPIRQALPTPTCETVICDRWNNHNGNCVSSMKACFHERSCRAMAGDLRDIAAKERGAPGCNPDCGRAAGICGETDVPGRPTRTGEGGGHFSQRGWPQWIMAIGGACIAVGAAMLACGGRRQRRPGRAEDAELVDEGGSASDPLE